MRSIIIISNFQILVAFLVLAKAKNFSNETDLLSLLDIKSHIASDDNPMQVTNTWNHSIHFCLWLGVSCSRRHNRVISLNLSSSNLVGTISSSIGNLTFLRELYLSNNGFHGVIPLEIGQLSRLEAIELDGNSLEGEIPSNISGCHRLSFINFEGNRLVGQVPWEALASLAQLTWLSIGNNNLTGTIVHAGNLSSSMEAFLVMENKLDETIPDSFGRLHNLKLLGLSLNYFHGPVPLSILNISSLEFFSVVLNNLEGRLPKNLGLASQHLKSFFISGNQFTGDIPQSLWNASNLQRVDLGANKFTGWVPTEIGLLKKLESLNVQGNFLGSRGAHDLDFITNLVNCSSLRVLYLAENNFGGLLPNSVANLSTNLQSLFVAYNQISGSIPQGLGELTQLKLLGVYYNQLVGPIPSSICKLKNLQDAGFGKNMLSGEIPSCIGNLTSINKLWLEQNKLEGSIPSSIGNCQNLLLLQLYGNKLSGNIPRELMSLSSLSISLTLDGNRFNGSIPPEIGNLRKLVKLNLSHNELSGPIPSSIGSCQDLIQLYLDHNFFEGSIPETLKSLRGIEVIDLSHNNLSGVIPSPLGKLPFLMKLNLSFNDLQGEMPVEGVFTNATGISVIGNNKLCGGLPALNLSNCHKNEPKKHINISRLVLIAISSFCGLLGICLTLYCLIFKKLGRIPSPQTLTMDDLPVSFRELYKATNGFSPENLIGKGGYSSVYKGILEKSEETIIAIKVLNLTILGSSKSFIAECKALINTRHRNLIKILTCCSGVDFEGNDFKALVFEFMPNGSLDMWLHPLQSNGNYLIEEMRSLSFLQRLNISVDLAYALDYLHNQSQTPIIHCDVKPSNILLNSDMVAHLSDFGLARFFKQPDNLSSSSSTDVGLKGTVGYAAPEYGMGSEVSARGDVYSYGIVLLEMFTGKRPTDEMFKTGLNLHNLVEMGLPEQEMEILDSELVFEMENESNDRRRPKKEKLHECSKRILRIGLACSMETPKERMDISDALKELQSIQSEF
ncbi:probable LRR receptor-like serine/threonine-protein kinase At3g47570 [Impatiens glandulifera]|uniref:probable LRR receptor-like serine/threonine-protein kinase At3g47570 n=1 Tax=Impatiens glandulifera TaxID=253017 RepID=UPI001FB127CD|nr:probable LRR receptor-like serine/threonine-protein kinase At3g47570 [Impatiens glandulifera]